ncbi:hypothetical protein L798_13133 [Zootermopsis nevadensis]|uniref:Uncharacterized protein n=1 Tax=Zootermopsis nevadensis TaxID=136037 RepID=A0A067QSS4_ZOONE|nr:hypothetical protein L798_13133 [Zootermopsis nevadensis]
MVSAIVSYAFEAIQDCAQENKVSLMKISTSLIFSRTGADKNSKCAIACVMERFYLIMGDQVETAMLAEVINMIPIEALKVPVTQLVNTCGKKGPDKCENASTFIFCLKQNGMTTATKALFRG